MSQHITQDTFPLCVSVPRWSCLAFPKPASLSTSVYSASAHFQHKCFPHLVSEKVTDLFKNCLSLSERSKPCLVQESGLSCRPAFFLLRAALTSVALHSYSQLSIMTALRTLRHTPVPSCKHTHNAHSLAVLQ